MHNIAKITKNIANKKGIHISMNGNKYIISLTKLKSTKTGAFLEEKNTIIF